MGMNRAKLISEPTDLVPVLRSFDSEVKRQVFHEITDKWCTTSEIEERYGEDGKEALKFFEKTKLVETKWEEHEGTPDKSYHSYYNSIHINTNAPITDLAEIFYVAAMDHGDFGKIEQEILKMIPDDTKSASARNVAEDLGMPMIRLRSIVKRSGLLEYQGHRIEKVS